VVSLDRVLEIDLTTLAVRSQRLAGRTTSRAAKRVAGWSLGATWTRADAVAVAGSSESYANGIRNHTATGLRLLDLRTGTVDILDRSSYRATLVGTTLVGHGGPSVRGYGLDGRVRFELTDGIQDSGYIQRAGRYLYVGSANSTRFVVVDAQEGRIVGRASTTKPTVILGP
jgi:hypothetical protein